MSKMLWRFVALLGALTAGCSATGSGDGGERVRITLRDYAAERMFELVSESHTDRVAYYSTPRDDASRKVQVDEAMTALVTELARAGLSSYAQGGAAPSRGGNALTRAFEVEQDGELRHWIVGSGTPPEERLAFNECVQTFLQLYNNSASYQTVNNEEGAAFFKQPDLARPPRPDARMDRARATAGRRRRVLAIVPARLGSTRLPRKMLLRDTGQFLFEHTVRNLEASPLLERVVLATDSAEIERAAREVGVEALSTSAEHASGTDRANEALALLGARDAGPWDVVLNVQGDEPELAREHLATLLEAFDDPAVEMATLCAPLERAAAEDRNVVKVVLDRHGDALYFSRAPIPAWHGAPSAPLPGAERQPLLRHVGVYAFRPAALARFCSLPRGALEASEGLEQLRWLESGGKLRVLQVEHAHGGIDTREQYEAWKARREHTEPLQGTRTP